MMLTRRAILAAAGGIAIGKRPSGTTAHHAWHIRRAAATMQVGRAAHTASPVAGLVMLAGGFAGEGESHRSTDLFDPLTGEIAAGPDLHEARHSHSSTLLGAGSVLLAGGYGTDAMANAEIVDLVTRTTRVLPPMTTARYGHTAILLPSGDVLIVGGVGPRWTFLESAEVFDPTTETFRTVGSMATPRESHTATLLADGRVLIAGGHHGRRNALAVLDSAELFDPSTETFQDAAPMSRIRHKHDAVRLGDGRVLLIAGADERDADGVYRTTDCYDPVEDRFTPGIDLLAARYKLAGTCVTLADGGIAVLGGAGTAELLDGNALASVPVDGSLEGARLFATGTAIGDDRAMIAGGYGGGVSASAGIWLLGPAS